MPSEDLAVIIRLVLTLALGFILASMSVEGVLKTAATIALVGPLLVLAVPLLDTSFVVLKRLKYGRRPWAADQNHFYHRFMRIGFGWPLPDELKGGLAAISASLDAARR